LRVFLNERAVPPVVFLLILEAGFLGASSNGFASPAAFLTPALDQFALLKLPSAFCAFTGTFFPQLAIEAFSAFVAGFPVIGFILEAILQVKNLISFLKVGLY